MIIRYLANAKINIGLNVTGKRSDGYHNLETVFYPLPVHDELTIEGNADITDDYLLEVEGLEVPSTHEENLIIKAFRLLQKEFILGKTRIKLTKNIPFGAGLGGGSSDAAFMLKALNELYDLNLSDDRLEEYAVKLGADCPFFIRNQAVFATGIGNIFSSVNLSLNGYQFVLVKPDIHVSTPEAYAGVRPAKPTYSLKDSVLLPVSQWREHIINDFEASVFKKYPYIAELKEFLYQSGALYATMSGSGSSVVGIFANGQPLPHFPDELVTFKGEF
jgi:4-diphosphocytidyl-2-C-methyl-D-erythritol kinase